MRPTYRTIRLPALLLSAVAFAACGQGSSDGTASAAAQPRGEWDPTTVVLLPEEPPPRGASQFSTDFSRHVVPYREMFSGGVPKDGIPPLYSPGFASVDEADEWLEPTQPVLVVEVGDEAKAYPLQVLTRHEIANDVVGGVPLAVTYCPLCNTGIAFERTVDGEVVTFGVSGNLRNSNLIMWDSGTETWWQQATGQGIAGFYAGFQLTFYPVNLVAWSDFRASHPGGSVLTGPQGRRPGGYGINPYRFYDSAPEPFLYTGPETSRELYTMARVLTIDAGEEAVAYPYQVLEESRVANDDVAGNPVVVMWQPGANSVLDASIIADARDVGSAVAFSRRVDGRVLTFEWSGDSFRDKETGSTWNLLGEASSGSLQGSKLSPEIAINHLWFSWYAFRPETRIYRG